MATSIGPSRSPCANPTGATGRDCDQPHADDRFALTVTGLLVLREAEGRPEHVSRPLERVLTRLVGRRGFLGRAAVAAPALALPAAVLATEDPLVPLGREFFALDERFHELDRAG